MKKVLAVVMTAILAAGMTVSAFASDGLADKKIALLLPGSIDDQGWNATNNAGAKAAEEELGVTIDVVESVPAAFRAITGNGVNVLAMGAFYVTPELGKQCADAFLYNDFGSGWEWWPDFDKFHQIAIDELNAFNYEEYKANGFKVKHLGDCHCELYDRPEGFSSVPLMCKR